MWLFRWWVFYPLVAALAAGLILGSMGPGLIVQDPRPVFGRIEDGALVLDGESLAYPQGSADTVHFIARNARWAPVGLRVAVLPDQGPAQGAAQGLRIVLAPERGAELGAGPLRVQVAMRPVPATTAPFLAVGVDRSGAQMQWASLPTTQLAGVLTFDFPAGDAAAAAIAIRPEATRADYNYGVEIAAIRITRAS